MLYFGVLLIRHTPILFLERPEIRGGSRIFSRGGVGGVGFSKKKNFFFRSFSFFSSTYLIFRAPPKQYKNPVWAKISAPQAKF